jgi:uncharacterized protein (TIGR02284 family)
VKAFFLEIAEQRRQFADELLPHAHRLGGETESADGSLAGTLHRGWMSVRDSLAPHDDATIVREAERGERAALAAYQEAVEGMLPPASRELIEMQRAQIEQAYRRLEALLARNAVGN